MRLADPKRKRHRQRTAEHGDAQRDRKSAHESDRIDAAEQGQDHKHRKRARQHPEHRNEPGRQLAQHNLSARKVRH